MSFSVHRIIWYVSGQFHHLDSRKINKIWPLGDLSMHFFVSLCRGFISLEGKSYVLEPSADHSDGTHWIYTAEHLSFAPGTCGHDFNISSPIEYADSSPFRAFSTRVRIIKLSAFYLQLQVNCQYWHRGLKESIYALITDLRVERWQERRGGRDGEWRATNGEVAVHDQHLSL